MRLLNSSKYTRRQLINAAQRSGDKPTSDFQAFPILTATLFHAIPGPQSLGIYAVLRQ